MSGKKGISRRNFLGDTAKVMAGAALGSAAVSRTARADLFKSILPQTVMGANERIRTGHIGLGGRGTRVLTDLLKRDDMQPIAVCDLWYPHKDRAANLAAEKWPPPSKHHDFREIIDNKDVDVVVIGTPDHWHAIPSIMACDAGKDVYCEKPLSTTIEEGRHMVNAARRNDTVFQSGTMQRSTAHFREAVEVVRSGHIGKIARAETWVHGNEPITGIGNPPDEDPPPGCDWIFHQGWTKHVPFNQNRWLYNFRWFLDYSGGKITDWGAHLVDIVLWAMGEDKQQPKSVTAHGGKFILTDNRTTPDTLEVVWEFDNYVLTFSNRVYNGYPNMADKRQHGIRFHGTLGTLHLDRAGFEVVPQERGDGCEPMKRESDWIMTEPHLQNFVDCIRSRQRPISDVENCHNTTRICHMGTCSYVAGGKLRWDPLKERFYGGGRSVTKKANKFAYRKYNNGWKLA